ncbi:MAG: hypothetical protein FWF10_01280 [Clostridiales bacterium]|nr:hypothetical protein [Clostridiales bacterium]
MKNRFTEEDGAVWHDFRLIEVGNGNGIARDMEFESLRATYVWFSTGTNVYQIFSVHMYIEQADLVELTLQGILDTIGTISGDYITGMEMKPLP